MSLYNQHNQFYSSNGISNGNSSSNINNNSHVNNNNHNNGPVPMNSSPDLKSGNTNNYMFNGSNFAIPPNINTANNNTLFVPKTRTFNFTAKNEPIRAIKVPLLNSAIPNTMNLNSNANNNSLHANNFSIVNNNTNSSNNFYSNNSNMYVNSLPSSPSVTSQCSTSSTKSARKSSADLFALDLSNNNNNNNNDSNVMMDETIAPSTPSPRSESNSIDQSSKVSYYPSTTATTTSTCNSTPQFNTYSSPHSPTRNVPSNGHNTPRRSIHSPRPSPYDKTAEKNKKRASAPFENNNKNHLQVIETGQQRRMSADCGRIEMEMPDIHLDLQHPHSRSSNSNIPGVITLNLNNNLPINTLQANSSNSLFISPFKVPQRSRSQPNSAQFGPSASPAAPELESFDLLIKQSPSKPINTALFTKPTPRTPQSAKDKRRKSQQPLLMQDETIFSIQFASLPPHSGSPRNNHNPANTPSIFSLFHQTSNSHGTSSARSSDPFDYSSLRSIDFEKEECVGMGGFARVWRCKRINNTNPEQQFILKEYEEAFTGLAHRSRLENRLKNLALINQYSINQLGVDWHPNLLKHYSVWQSGGHLHLLTEICEKYDAGRLISTQAQAKANNSPLIYNENLVWQLVIQIGHGLLFLHQNSIIHMDVKPSNCLLNDDNVFKLGDLDSCIKTTDRAEDDEFSDGQYTAPEVLNSSTQKYTITTKADIYSLGLTLYVMCTGCLASKDIDCNLSFDFHNAFFPISKHLQQLILSMTQLDYELRPNIEHVLSTALSIGHI